MPQTDGMIYHVLGWKNQYCQNDYTTQGNLYIQYNTYQITKGISHRTRTKKNCKFVWKNRRPHIVKAILGKKNGAGGVRFPDFRL